MARPLRIHAPNLLYHVTARGNERKAIFRDDQDRQFYLQRLAHYRQRDGFRLLAYCLMPNHVHLAIQIGEIPLSKSIAGLHSSYTQAFNRRHRRVGHLFQGRYHARLVDRENYGQTLIRYIHQNPVEAQLAPRDIDFRWSSARAWWRGEATEWLDLAVGLNLFGSRRPRAIENYRSFAPSEGAAYEAVPVIEQQIVGSEEFAEAIRPAKAGRSRQRGARSLEAIVQEILADGDLTLPELRQPGSNRQAARVRARIAAAALEAGIPIARSARFLGRDGSVLTKAVGRLRGS